MTGPTYEAVRVGEAIPPLTLPPVARGTLALFAVASGDHNPIHLDPGVARAAGMGDVFAQGMLVMAWAGRALSAWAPRGSLRQFGVRFTSLTRPGDVLTCSGTILEKREEEGERRVRLRVEVADAGGDVKLAGQALVALP